MIIILNLIKDFILKHKKVLISTIGILITLLTIVIMKSTINKLEKDLNASVINNKAYSNENSTLKNNTRVFLLTIDQLNDSKDSLNVSLNDTKKALKIKDKNLIAMQSIKDHFTKKDTTILRDTTFVKGLDIDTIIGDKFYTLNLRLQYPNIITDSISIVNTKQIFISRQKETINPPKKFFLLRWFQKKQEVIIVNIKDSNPYIIKDQDRFIQIFK
jgi:hypothetical protein